jgi:uncharacterized protein (UPF0216 family)
MSPTIKILASQTHFHSSGQRASSSSNASTTQNNNTSSTLPNETLAFLGLLSDEEPTSSNNTSDNAPIHKRTLPMLRSNESKSIFAKLALPVIVIFAFAVTVARAIAIKGRKAAAFLIAPKLMQNLNHTESRNTAFVGGFKKYMPQAMDVQFFPYYFRLGSMLSRLDWTPANQAKMFYSIYKSFVRREIIESFMKKQVHELENVTPELINDVLRSPTPTLNLAQNPIVPLPERRILADRRNT